MNASALIWSFKANEHITHPSLQQLTSGAIGVVLGDIGTSPRYAFRAELNPEPHGPPAEFNDGRTALPSPEQGGQSVSLSGDEGQGALQAARRR